MRKMKSLDRMAYYIQDILDDPAKMRKAGLVLTAAGCVVLAVADDPIRMQVAEMQESYLKSICSFGQAFLRGFANSTVGVGLALTGIGLYDGVQEIIKKYRS